MSPRPIATSLAGAIDQGLFSLGNILMVAGLAATLPDATAFGAFALLMTVYETVQLLLRGFLSQPLALVLQDSDDQVAIQGATALGLMGGAVPMLVGFIVIAAVGSVPLSGALMMIALVFPFVSAQEVCRSTAFASGRVHVALLIDLVWTGWQVMMMATLWIAGRLGATEVALCWVIGCLLSFCVGVLALGNRPAPTGVPAYLMLSRQYVVGFTRDNLLSAAQTHGFLWLAASFGGLITLGQMRLLRALFGLATVSIAGLRISMTPVVRRAWNNRSERTYFRLLGLAGCFVFASILANLVIIATPAGSWLLRMFDDTVVNIDALIMPYTLMQVALACTVIAVIAVSATGRTRALALPRFTAAVLSVSGGALGFAVSGLGTALLLSAIGSIAALPSWALALRRILRHQDSASATCGINVTADDAL